MLFRRYVVTEVSSELKGNTAYFKELSRHMDNVGGRVAFYRYLMARDIENFDWDNEKPVTIYQSQMVEMSMDKELIFLRDILTKAFMKKAGSIVSHTCTELFEDFNSWITEGKINYHPTIQQFGLKMTKVVPDNEPGFTGVVSRDATSLEGASKRRIGAGWLYTFHVDVAMESMIEKKWFGLTAAPMRSCGFDDE
jgi:hypothetical protein